MVPPAWVLTVGLALLMASGSWPFVLVTAVLLASPL